jgi:hypothetical protein
MNLMTFILNSAMIVFLLKRYFDWGAGYLRVSDLLLVLFGIATLIINIFIYLGVAHPYALIIDTLFVCIASWYWWKDTEDKILLWGAITFGEMAISKSFRFFIKPIFFNTPEARFAYGIISMVVDAIFYGILSYLIIRDTRIKKFALLVSITVLLLLLYFPAAIVWEYNDVFYSVFIARR